jgi:hypothetical protein
VQLLHVKGHDHSEIADGAGSIPAGNIVKQSHQWLTERMVFSPRFSHFFAVPPPRSTKVLSKTVDFLKC